MRISLLTSDRPSRWYDPLWAALIFFTRLPFWRIHQPPKASYERVVEYWPLTGWLTGGLMAGSFLLFSRVLPDSVSVLLALMVRLLVTGALHEDGLADFADGFGGAATRERTLAIMKDSRIGTYGVLALVAYGLIILELWCAYSWVYGNLAAALFMVAADAYGKLMAAQIVQFLPYARTVDTAKNGVVYRRLSVRAGIGLFVQGMLPMAAFLYITDFHNWEWIIFLPAFAMYFLYLLMNRRLRGYTGDCCGALFLICELACVLGGVLQTAAVP